MSSYVFKDDSIIGNLEAETDIFLKECFVQTPAFEMLKNFDSSSQDFFKRIIVGRTGTGKTALLKQLEDSSSISVCSVIEAEKTIFEHIKNNRFISKLTENEIDLRIFFKALWFHVILVKIIELSTEKSNLLQIFFQSGDKIEHKEKIQNYYDTYKDTFFEDEALTEITKRFSSQLEVNANFANMLNANGALGDDLRKSIQSSTNQFVNKELIQAQKSITKFLSEHHINDKQRKIIIQIDDLDKSWFQNDSVHYTFIGALLEAFKELLSIESIKILISIRSDILEGVYLNKLKQEEKDISLILPLEWNKDGLRDVLDRRVKNLLKNQYSKKQYPLFSDVFDCTIAGEKADEYILKRTMLRPRDAIDFVNTCFRKAKGKTEITQEHIVEAEESFYISRKDALVKEWSGIFKEINIYLDALSLIEKQKFSLNYLIKKKNEIAEFILDRADYISDESVLSSMFSNENVENGFKDLLNIWFKVGVIGIFKSEEVSIFSSFDRRKLDVTDFRKEFIMHPLFWRY